MKGNDIMFLELKKDKVSEVEESISTNWKKINLLDKTIHNRTENDNFVFYDGPATANGMPGVHHMLAKLLKDTFCKYQTMQGKKVFRKVGWDTHGLPVEVQVEKELGFQGKGDIEKYGIREFNDKCRESVWKNEKAFRDFTDKMGQFIDLDNPYITYDNNYIETEWWILSKFFEAGHIYDGLKIVPYCPRCGTGLASHEVAQGYKEITVNTVTVPLKLKNEENTYFLVWTTTPWTLIANVAICVNPNEEYVKCLVEDKYYIVAKKLANKVLGDDCKIVETMLGRELEYKEYEQLMPYLEVPKKAFYVVCADYVTMDDGTGIVHQAPAFGQDDYEVCLQYNLPVLNPVGEDGCYTEGPWKGRLVVDSELEIDIIKYLATEDKIYKKQKMMHNYPHCWRCKTPLVYYSKPSLYIKTTAFKDKIIAANKTVNWYPSYVGEKRFGNWLENMNDWSISRNRYWGTPIPLWKCSCGHEEMISSREELVERAIESIDTSIDLHRPYVDAIHITCPKCNNEMNRIKDVIDCWFDSGAMPFAQYHYPFENVDLFESQFPADFISEGIDQTRGWFYSLLVISTFIKGCSPYKNVLVNDLLLDKFGQKMHKSKGNAVEPFGIMNQYGADATRWYMLYASPVWTPLKFDEEGIKEVQSKFFSTLKNTYAFFQLYANTDGVDPRDFLVEDNDLEEIDRWLISKYQHILISVTAAMDEYDLNKAVHLLQNFVVEDLSNWYIRRNRRRFWGSELTPSKAAVYKTTYDVLVGICKMVAPMAPFLVEEIYQKLTGEESVHLADYPKADERLLNDEIEERMDLVRTLISLGRNVREEVKIKVRQPISEVILDAKSEILLGDLTSLMKEELNVKEVVFVTDLSIYMNMEMKPNFKLCGKIFGSNMKEFQIKLTTLKEEEVRCLEKGESISLLVAGNTEIVTSDMVEVRISSKEGFNAAHEGNNFIVLNTTLTEELIMEGLVRELISKVQQLRKNKDFDIADRIVIYYDGNNEFVKAINTFENMIKVETLAIKIETKTDIIDVYQLNGLDIKLDVEKVN